MTKIEITDVRSEDGGQAIDLTCDLITDKGVTVISGLASAVLPSRQTSGKA